MYARPGLRRDRPPATDFVIATRIDRSGACPPRRGRGGEWQNPPCQFAVPSHNSGFSYLGVPVAAGMSDWYEDALKRLSSAPADPSIRHSREGGNPRTNILRKHVKLDTTAYVRERPHFVNLGPSFRHSSESRNPEGVGRGKRAKHQMQTPPARNHLIRPGAYLLRRNTWYAFTNSAIGVMTHNSRDYLKRQVVHLLESNAGLTHVQLLATGSLYALRNHS